MPPKKRNVRAAYHDDDEEEQEGGGMYRNELDDFDEFANLLKRGPKPLGNRGYSFMGFSMSKPTVSMFDQNAWVIASNTKTVMDRLSSFLSLVHKYDGELDAKENMVAKRIVQWLDLIKQKLTMLAEERRILEEVTKVVHERETNATPHTIVWDRIQSMVNTEKNECSRAMDEFSIWIDELVVAITVMRNKQESTMLRSAPFPSCKHVATAGPVPLNPPLLRHDEDMESSSSQQCDDEYSADE